MHLTIAMVLKRIKKRVGKWGKIWDMNKHFSTVKRATLHKSATTGLGQVKTDILLFNSRCDYLLRPENMFFFTGFSSFVTGYNRKRWYLKSYNTKNNWKNKCFHSLKSCLTNIMQDFSKTNRGNYLILVVRKRAIYRV